VTNMAAICAICKSQFTKVLPYYGLDMDMIVSVHQLVSNAVILTGQTEDDEDDEESAEDSRRQRPKAAASASTALNIDPTRINGHKVRSVLDGNSER
jgi:hypothetical protein